MSKNYNWRNDLLFFVVEMQNKLNKQLKEKGEPSKENLKNCPVGYLKEKLNEHLQAGNYEDVANYAFLLKQQKEGNI